MSSTTDLFADSCDHYDNSAQIGLKWTNNGGGQSVANGRNGRGIQLGSIEKSLPYRANWSISWAMNFQGNGFTQAPIYLLSATGLNTMVQVSCEGDNSVSVYGGARANLVGNSGGSNVFLQQNIWYSFQLVIQLTGSKPIGATVKLKINGLEVINGSASTGVNEEDTLLQMVAANSHVFSSSVIDGVTIGDDFAIAATGEGGTITDYMGDIALSVIYPASDNTIQWTGLSGGSQFSQINSRYPVGDSSYVFSYTADQADNFLWQPVADETIVFVHFGVYARKDDEGTRSFAGIVGSTAAPVLTGPVVYPGDLYAYYFFGMDSDPATTAQWTKSGFDATFFGFNLVS